ncbi:XrtA/PEP-CTERM system histidine kinase PrsK [Rubrivivax rivuli]|uniref:XrtA/PEP-CTERM system histidine kinase PrsK n=1 Tax=Rubrivivax rivuli TaxID=1862385 RepID=UPI001FDF0633|nr:XrtA/PEP-CTERM system histidine kinase PrsK [Rubrivivax rivuli]
MSALAHGVFALYMSLASARQPVASETPRRLFIGALVASAAWNLLSVWHEMSGAAVAALAASAADLVRYGLWFGFLLTLLGANGQVGRQGTLPALKGGASLTWLGAAALWAVQGFSGGTVTPGVGNIAAALTLAVCGLLLVEQLFRNIAEGGRWNAKPACLGLGCVFGFDLYLYAEGLLFSKFDDDVLAFRSVAHALAIPLLLIAARRNVNWLARLQVSHAAAFHSATLLLTGTYLLLMAAIGYYVRWFGGEWGRALQLGLLVAGLVSLGVLVFSGSVRAWLRVFVSKHFYRYRYDYREEWLRFTTLLSANRSPQEMGDVILQALAKMVESPAGSLWLRGISTPDFHQVSTWNTARAVQPEPRDGSLCTFLRDKGWVVDLDEYRASPRRYESLSLPAWLLGMPNGWLVVPLMAGEELRAFAVLARPRTAIQLNWEVLDLLKTAGRQAAGYLAQMQATDALLEARKFDAFNKMSAFVVHDLKNIVTQLSLMLKNAERLHDNREFQQDMLLTVASSLEKMKRLMLQLREGATPPGGNHGVELEPILNRLVGMAQAQGRTVDVGASEPLASRGQEERLERVLGHLVQNALDATPPSGRVWVKVERHSGQVKVEVGDTGSGMSEEFIRSRLFRPFNTTKSNGMGIGTYESFQYIRELGGHIDVRSALGEGTVITVLLPLFESGRGAELLGAHRK